VKTHNESIKESRTKHVAGKFKAGIRSHPRLQDESQAPTWRHIHLHGCFPFTAWIIECRPQTYLLRVSCCEQHCGKVLSIRRHVWSVTGRKRLWGVERGSERDQIWGLLRPGNRPIRGHGCRGQSGYRSICFCVGVWIDARLGRLSKDSKSDHCETDPEAAALPAPIPTTSPHRARDEGRFGPRINDETVRPCMPSADTP
jgi:hypothetical protein